MRSLPLIVCVVGGGFTTGGAGALPPHPATAEMALAMNRRRTTE